MAGPMEQLACTVGIDCETSNKDRREEDRVGCCILWVVGGDGDGVLLSNFVWCVEWIVVHEPRSRFAARVATSVLLRKTSKQCDCSKAGFSPILANLIVAEPNTSL